jgi:hypothetical protein
MKVTTMDVDEQAVAVVQAVVVASNLGGSLLGSDFVPVEASPIPDDDVAAMLAEIITDLADRATPANPANKASE